jgi:MSHA biogenesis protein MshG
MRDMVENLESGRDLSNSLARHPDIFSGLFVNIIHVGEQSGHLEHSFLQISKHLEQEKLNRDRIKAATRYPKIVIAAIVVALVVINVFVIPAFSSTFARFGSDLPLPTQILVASSSLFMNYWPHMIMVLVLMVFGASSYLKTEHGCFNWDRLKLKTPVLGDIILRTTLGRFTHSFAMSLRAGVPLVQALSMVSKTLDNRYIESHIVAMRSSIERGETLTKTATATGIFTPLVLQMLAVGEETGNVDDMMDEVAEYYEREVDYDLNFVGDAIEPILLIIIGIMVLMLALGVFLPMWEMSSVALKR